MKIGIIAAMDKEYQNFVSLQNNKELKDKNIVLHKCGIGKVNAAVGAYEFIVNQKPDLVVSTGVAGGCGEDLQIMDTVAAQTVCYHDVWCGQPNVYGQIQGMPAQYSAPMEVIDTIKSLHLDNVKTGLTVSGDWFVDKVEKMQEIKQLFPDALAVDMESGAIAQVCYKMNVPFLSLRIISDIPLKENNHQQYDNFWEKLADNSFLTAKQIILSL